MANAHFCILSIWFISAIVRPLVHTGEANSATHLICFSYTSSNSATVAPRGFNLLNIHNLANAFWQILIVTQVLFFRDIAEVWLGLYFSQVWQVDFIHWFSFWCRFCNYLTSVLYLIFIPAELISMRNKNIPQFSITQKLPHKIQKSSKNITYFV